VFVLLIPIGAGCATLVTRPNPSYVYVVQYEGVIPVYGCETRFTFPNGEHAHESYVSVS
jgi:hypothetical protein